MSFDGMVAGAVARQLQAVLTGGKIEKIFQPEADELVIHIHSGNVKHRLYISANGGHARIHLMKNNITNPEKPMAFCMLLRKHFQGGRITEIKQMDSERLIEIYISHINEMGYTVSKKLIAEIMGKHSNIIAIDLSSGKIIDSIKHISIDLNRYRQLLPGLPYIYPPDQGKVSFYTLTKEKLSVILEDKSVSKSKALVAGIQGLSPVIAGEICSIASERFHIEPEYLSTEEIYPVILDLSERICSGRFSPVVYLDNNRTPLDFHIFPLSAMEGLSDKIHTDDVSEAVEYFYINKFSSNRTRQKSSDLVKTINSALDKLYLKKQRLSEELMEAENSEAYRLYGELLTANLHAIKNGSAKAEVMNYYDNKILEIPLDPRFTPSKNAQRYFKKYGKAKTAIKEKSIQLAETNHIIGYLESVQIFAEHAETVEEIEEIRQELAEGGYLRMRKNNYRSSKSGLRPLIYATSDGFRVIAGRNNKENDRLTFKVADKKDIWFHTKDIPGSHVILITEGRQPTETAIFEAASLAAFYSRARDSENVPVDYTKVRHVKKPAGAKPGMVIFTDNRTVYVNPGKLSEE